MTQEKFSSFFVNRNTEKFSWAHGNPNHRNFENFLRLREYPKHKHTLNMGRVETLLQVLEEIPSTGEISKDHISYAERFMELMVDMMARLPTRRWFHLILESTHMITHSELSHLAHRREGQLFLQLLEMLKFYDTFEVDDLKAELQIH